MAVTYNIKGTSNPSFKIGKNGVVLSPTDNTSETTLTLPNATGTLVLQDSTDTLSNKSFSGNIAFDTNTLFVDADNNRIGIGTTSPTIKLSVEGTSADVASFIRGNNSGSGQIHLGNSDGYVRVGGANGSFTVYNSTNTSARLYIDNTGKVGIGNNTSPTEELDVTGDGAFSGNVTITGNLTVNGTTTTVNSTEVNIQNAFVFEGATADDYETTLTVADPTADRTITLPNATGTIVLQDTTDTLSNKTLTSPTLTSPTFSGTASGSLAIANTTTDDSLLITTTEDSSTAGPVIALKRNSASPADADYIGQVKFKGENDADQEITYAKITGKILDATDGSEDGMLEYAFIKGGSQNISGRFRSDQFQLLNGTTLYVGTGGSIQFEGATADDYETTLTLADPTADRTITLPDATGTVVLADATQTLTNKTLGATTISGHLTPSANVTYDLGTSAYRFRDIYLSGSTIDLGGAKLTNDGSDNLDIKDSSGNRKIIRASAIELVDSNGKKMKLERDATTGKLKKTRKNADDSDEGSSDTLDIVTDTSPQLGGDLDTNGNDINFADNNKAQFGTSNDLAIYHDGTQSIIEDVGTGQLKILAENTLHFGSATGTETYIRALKNGATEFYHDSSKKLETTSTGILTTGTLNINSAYQFPTADGSASQFLQTDGLGNLSFATVLTSVVSDTTPQLGGDLDVNGNSITSTSNGDVDIAPHGTGNAKITSTGALILPVGTTAQRPTTPVVGMFRFNSTTDKFEGYNGATWVILGTDLITGEATDYGVTTSTAISNHDYGAITDADSITIDYEDLS